MFIWTFTESPRNQEKNHKFTRWLAWWFESFLSWACQGVFSFIHCTQTQRSYITITINLHIYIQFFCTTITNTPIFSMEKPCCYLNQRMRLNNEKSWCDKILSQTGFKLWTSQLLSQCADHQTWWPYYCSQYWRAFKVLLTIYHKCKRLLFDLTQKNNLSFV